IRYAAHVRDHRAANVIAHASQPSGDLCDACVRAGRRLHTTRLRLPIVALLQRYSACMSTVQIRNLDDGAYETLKARATSSGRSLQEYLRLLLEDEASRPSVAEILEATHNAMNWTRADDDGITMKDIVEIQRE